LGIADCTPAPMFEQARLYNAAPAHSQGRYSGRGQLKAPSSYYAKNTPFFKLFLAGCTDPQCSGYPED
jgi:hypothetical protein